METFTQIKPLVFNPHFEKQRERMLNVLDMNTIDDPIKNIINGLTLMHCRLSLQGS